MKRFICHITVFIAIIVATLIFIFRILKMAMKERSLLKWVCSLKLIELPVWYY